MLKFKNAPFEEDIEKATDEKNLTEDWALIMLICDKAVNYQDGSKFCFKAILKRLHHSVPRVSIQTLTLLDACVKNCDRRFLLQVASSEFIQEARKLLSKMHPSVSLKFKELIQKWAFEEFRDDPELCIIPSFYYKLKSEGVDFPPKKKEEKIPPPVCTDPDAVSSQQEENDIIKAIEMSMKDSGKYHAPVEHENHSQGYPSNAEPFKSRALYDFEAAEDNELTIMKGEIVFVLDSSNSHWWKGSNHRGEGLFPANFVTKDLTAKPEELPVQEISSNKTSIDEALETIEVTLDENKIEMAIKWLNEADPTGEIPDPQEMLTLERECLRMVPLLEENFQAVDNRLARLNLVNKQIMNAFELFHSLSHSGQTSGQSMSQRHQMSYNGVQGAVRPQPVASLPVVTELQNHPSAIPRAFYLPAQSVGPQFVVSSDLMQGKQFNSLPAPVFSQPLVHPRLDLEIASTTGSDQQSSKTQLSTVNSVTSSGQTEPVPSAMHYTTFPPHPYAAFVQNQRTNVPTPVPNYMTLPYSVSSAGSYIPFPYYYLNSSIQTPPHNTPVSAASNLPNTLPSQELLAQTQGSIQANTLSTTVVASNYSTDLHPLNTIATHSDENEAQLSKLSYQTAAVQCHGTVMSAGEQL